MSRRMFPLSHRREDTFHAGFSMGGFGAIRNGLKYYDTFGYIAVLSGALQVFEAPPDSPYWSLFGERSVFGGPDRDRSDDLTDAKKTYKPFYTISNYLRCFPLSFSFFPPLFRTLISMCCTTVFGASCGQKRSPPFAGNGFPAWTGSVFHTSDCLHCNSDGRIQQVISAPSMPQKLGSCNQRFFRAYRNHHTMPPVCFTGDLFLDQSCISIKFRYNTNKDYFLILYFIKGGDGLCQERCIPMRRGNR